MQNIQINISYAGSSDDIAIISPRGYIDTTTAPELEKKLEEQLALNKYKIIVDLKNIDYVSSAGWGVFVSEIREIRENNGDLVLINMSPDVYDVYELMEFSSILKSYDNLDSAISNFGGEIKPEVKKPVTSQISTGNPEQNMESITKEKKEEKKNIPEAQKTDIMSLAKSERGKRILSVILDNPYFEVKEIAKALKLPQYGGKKERGGTVKKELKAMGLYDKQKRFEIALKSRG